MPSEASDAFARVWKVSSEGSDAFARVRNTPSEGSDAFARVGNTLEQAKKYHLRVFEENSLASRRLASKCERCEQVKNSEAGRKPCGEHAVWGGGHFDMLNDRALGEPVEPNVFFPSPATCLA